MRKALAVFIMCFVLSAYAQSLTPEERVAHIEWITMNWHPYGSVETTTSHYHDWWDENLPRTLTLTKVELFCGYQERKTEKKPEIEISNPTISIFEPRGSRTSSIRISGNFIQRITIAGDRGVVFGEARLDVGPDGTLGYFEPGFMLEYPHPLRDSLEKKSVDLARELVDDILVRCMHDMKERANKSSKK